MADRNHSSQHVIACGLTHLLCEQGLLSTEHALRAEQMAHKNNVPLVSCLVRNQFISSDVILQACETHFKLPSTELTHFDPQLLNDGTMDPALADRYHVLPIARDEHSLQIALSDPTDHAAIAAVRFHTGLRIHPVVVNEKDLDRLLHTHCRPNILYSQLKAALARMETPPAEDHDDNYLQEEPVIQFVNQLLADAVAQQVSDIHIESFAACCRIRFRRDGLLHETATLPQSFAARIITRLKIMANLDIAEKRLPQDGRLLFEHQLKTDIRVSTCPGLHGEHIALRILRHAAAQLPLSQLGMTETQLTLFQQALQRPQGLILVTGPTGSGKTATLYSALQQLNQTDKNILTVEDPVEIELPGITQVHVNTRIGLDFAATLRAFLRQDPDIIMVGEIRDTETAAIAVQAAQTGHLVLSTLHTNNAMDTIKRLLAMRVPSYQLAGSLTLIAAQRLVRKVCQHCLQQNSCEYCRHGYDGRTGIFEMLPISPAVRQLLLEEAEPARIEKQLLAESHVTLPEAGMEKVNAGITSYAELIRVAGECDYASLPAA